MDDTLLMDAQSAPSWERAQRLYDKNIELENRRRRSAQARVPSDPNAWLQMRENCEAIILEDHSFSEQHNIEYALWQLHYRRIEELRGHFSTALASSSSKTQQDVVKRPDRVSKIRLQFKTFLSEATGFYHDLILKIRSKYGLPLGYFSEDSDNLTVTEKDGKKSADIKRGLVSCHRCLIYLGDLARYKGLYGEVDSKTREYAAASGYYLQAAAVWPSNGNPHHQLSIIASYSGDELVAIYRYFRSLAVDSPFSTARDNLIVAFEKNRQSYSQLPGDVRISFVKESPSRFGCKGRRKGDAKVLKDRRMECSPLKDRESTIQEKYKFFCTRFIRLNGILFTRTSLETFAEVLSLVSSGLSELLSSGPEKEMNLGIESSESALVIVRVISILIFTVHNANKETEGQTYAEIIQRAVLLQNAHAAVFELVGCIMESCLQLRDLSSSFLLPGLLVFVEWLACCPVMVAKSEMDNKEASVRSRFWKLCVSFFNKLLLMGPMFIDEDEDETCFFNMSRYEYGASENRLALWEDFELRGFVPLLPAQTILDFSRKHSFGNDSTANGARVKRIVAAGKVLANMVKIDQKSICFDSKARKFVIGVESQVADDSIATSFSGMPNAGMVHETEEKETEGLGVMQANPQVFVGEDEDDEVIVFKPLITEKRTDVVGPVWGASEGLGCSQNAYGGDVRFHGVSGSSSPNKLQQLGAFDASLWTPSSIGDSVLHHQQQTYSHALNCPTEEISLTNSVKGFKFLDTGHLGNFELQKDKNIYNSAALSTPIQQTSMVNDGVAFCKEQKPLETLTPSRIATNGSSGDLTLPVNTSLILSAGVKKNPISRPVRHSGPPPGFGPVLPKQVNEYLSTSEFKSEYQVLDDYSWLDGYQFPSTTNGSGHGSSIQYSSQISRQQVTNSNGFGSVGFPYFEKHVSLYPQFENQLAGKIMR